MTRVDGYRRGVPITDSELRRAATWLRGHNLAVAPTPLLAARLAARRQALTGLLAAFAVVALLFVVSQGWWIVAPWPSSGAVGVPLLVSHAVTMLAVVAIIGVAVRRIARADHRLGATLAVRVAHAPRGGWPAIVGGRRLRVMAVLYGGSAAVALAAFSFNASATGRTAAVVLLAARGALFALTAAGIAGVVRRPVLAEDEVSLRVDDVLRATDAQGLANPMLPAVLVSVTVGLDPYPKWLNLCSMVLTILVLVELVRSLARPGPERVAGRADQSIGPFGGLRR